MAKKKEAADPIRDFITANPTAPDHTVHGELKLAGVDVTVDDVQSTRAAMGPRHTWEAKPAEAAPPDEGDGGEEEDPEK